MTIVDGESTISCIVEVKMNWFPTVVDRIKSQLVERYLAGPATDAGVFVVLWFAGADWDESERYDLNLWIGHLLEGAAYLPR